MVTATVIPDMGMGGTSVAALGCRLIFDAVLEPFEEAACVFWVESSFVSTFGGRLRPSKSARSAFAHCRRLRGRHAESPARGEGVKHCAARTAAPAAALRNPGDRFVWVMYGFYLALARRIQPDPIHIQL